MKNILILLFAWLTTSPITLLAQVRHSSLTGQVKDDQNTPLPGATIQLTSKRDTLSATADRRGTFAFKGLPNGNYSIKVTYVGLRSFQDNNLELTDTHPTIALPPVILLPNNQQRLKDVVVSAQKPLIEQKIDRTIVNVDAMISAAASNMFETLAKSPGVMIDANDNISLNGKSNVLVLIDNRPTYMSGADLGAYLRSLPAGLIDKIELLPTPPAQYDAAGAAVINIVLKKYRDSGFSGGINLSGNQGFYGRSNDVFTFNLRHSRSNLFGNLGYAMDKNYSNTTFNRFFYDSSGMLQSSTRQTGNYHYTSNAWNARLGMDFFPDKQTTLGWMVSGLTRPRTDLLTYKNERYSGLRLLDSGARGSTTGRYAWEQLSANINAAHIFKKSKANLTADLDWVHYPFTSDQQAPLVNYLPNGAVSSSQDYEFLSPGGIDVYTAKTDYTASLLHGADLATGVKFSWVSTNCALNWFDENNHEKTPDYGRSNHFLYTENINGAYININKQWSRWGLQAGVRAENTNSMIHQLPNPVVHDTAFSRAYTNLFPAVYGSYKLDSGGMHRLVLSYTRKIRRPGYQQLNPFLFYQDQYTYNAGNPNLRPYFNQYVELRYTYKQYVGLTSAYAYGSIEIQSLTQALGDTLITRPANFILYRALSLIPYLSLHPLQWWNFHLNAVLVYIRNTGSAPGVTVDQKANIHEIEISNEFRISHKWSAELDGFFPGKQTFAQSQSDRAPYNISGGVRYIIVHGQGTLSLTFNDLFGTFSKAATQTIGIAQVSSFSTRATDTRRIGIGFSYHFGKAINARKVRHDDGGAQDEQDRAK